MPRKATELSTPCAQRNPQLESSYATALPVAGQNTDAAKG
jgi:hypothetical protein